MVWWGWGFQKGHCSHQSLLVLREVFPEKTKRKYCTCSFILKKNYNKEMNKAKHFVDLFDKNVLITDVSFDNLSVFEGSILCRIRCALWSTSGWCRLALFYCFLLLFQLLLFLLFLFLVTTTHPGYEPGAAPDGSDWKDAKKKNHYI